MWAHTTDDGRLFADSDPHGAQEDSVGFWASFPICHPATGDRLVFDSDLNRGLYILRLTGERCSRKRS